MKDKRNPLILYSQAASPGPTAQLLSALVLNIWPNSTRLIVSTSRFRFVFCFFYLVFFLDDGFNSWSETTTATKWPFGIPFEPADAWSHQKRVRLSLCHHTLQKKLIDQVWTGRNEQGCKKRCMVPSGTHLRICGHLTDSAERLNHP